MNPKKFTKTEIRHQNCMKSYLRHVKNSDYTFAQLNGCQRSSDLVDERQRIAKELKKEGYSFPAIGKAMDRDHSSILHLVNKR